MYVFKYMSIHIYTYTYTYIHTNEYLMTQYTSVLLITYMYVYTWVHIYGYTYTYIYTHLTTHNSGVLLIAPEILPCLALSGCCESTRN